MDAVSVLEVHISALLAKATYMQVVMTVLRQMITGATFTGMISIRECTFSVTIVSTK